MTIDLVDETVDRIGRIRHKPGYSFRVEHENPVTAVTVVLWVKRPDLITNEPGVGRAGSYTVRPGLTDGQFFQAILGMLLSYEEHETREWLTIDGVNAFNPHINFDAMKIAAVQVDY